MNAVERDLVHDQTDRYEIGSVHAKAFVSVVYRDQLGTEHRDYFEISPRLRSVTRISEDRFQALVDRLSTAGAHMLRVNDMTTTRVYAEFLDQVGA